MNTTDGLLNILLPIYSCGDHLFEDVLSSPPPVIEHEVNDLFVHPIFEQVTVLLLEAPVAIMVIKLVEDLFCEHITPQKEALRT